MAYPFREIEPKWQRLWEEQRLFRAVDLPAPSIGGAQAGGAQKKFYILDMFPYPSGAGLHVGHPEGYTATDIVARFKRMQGFNVLHPMGWDAFGLPAEQYAIETGTHPAVTTRKNIKTFKGQIRRLGFSYDWDREIDTTDPAYVKWTQWIFLKLYERGLAYMAEAPVWWCPSCGTVLANEEVVNGTCERKNHPVERKPMRQWMLKITAYADRLLADLESLNWPNHIKDMQRHWIGRSEGADVWFGLQTKAGPIPDSAIDGTRVRRREGAVELKIYTTRPDTLFGATYMVLAPEHPLVPLITPENRRVTVDAYRAEAARKSELERSELAKEKTGVFTGAYAVNPVNDEKIPIWIAEYVLASYGTGAIMAVPAHDQRDLEFALSHGLDVRIVIMPEDRALELVGLTQAFEEPGRMHDSGPFTGLPSDEGKRKITEWLAGRVAGQRAVNYKLRDWLFSRQRYWGEPIPVVHCPKDGVVPLPESALPLDLPHMDDIRPVKDVFVPTTKEAPLTGGVATTYDVVRFEEPESPLARAKKDNGTFWKDTTCPTCKGPAERETNTMPQWAGSCWYYLRYLDPKNDRRAWDPAKEKYWMPVDLYVGGAEHAVLHLLYARFWHKVLYDAKLVSTPEPFKRLINQGLILGEDGEKMSKSRGNVVNPDDVIEAHGADAFRLYEMFMGPLEAVKPWNTRSIEGVARFLDRLWRLVVREDGSLNPAITSAAPSGEVNVLLHQTIKAVSDDMEHLRFNTAISQSMVLTNRLTSESSISRAAVEALVLMVAPLAPHLGEELWQRLGHAKSLAHEPWPAYDPKVLRVFEVQLVVQVNGKVRARVTVPSEATEDQVKQAVLADAGVKKFVDGQTVKQCIVVPKRLVNIVV